MAGTFYAGDAIEVTATGTDFDGATQLTPTSVTRLSIEIAARTTPPTVVVPEVTMSWDATHLNWYYLWNSTSSNTGNFQAKITIYALDGSVNFDYQTFRLAPAPF